jgi:hypothetical protein
MFSIAKSRHSNWANLGFVVVNALGFFFGMVYNMSTPDLYENNAHHKIGWIFSAIAVVWTGIGFVRSFTSKRSKKPDVQYEPLMQNDESPSRWSDDSGRATLRNLSIGSTSPVSGEQYAHSAFLTETLPKLEEEEEEQTQRARSGRLNRFIGTHIAKHVTGKTMWLLNFLYVFIERTLLFMMFIAVSTGFVTFGGIFVSQSQTPIPPNTDFSSVTAKYSPALPTLSKAASSSGLEFSPLVAGLELLPTLAGHGMSSRQHLLLELARPGCRARSLLSRV